MNVSAPVDTAVEEAVKKERERILEVLDKRMAYYAETIQVMSDLCCPEGKKAAEIALETVRNVRQELMMTPERLAAFLMGRSDDES